MTVLDSLNSALHAALAADPCVCLLGEDILDPYGGAFRVTRGLSSAYPGRVFTTPISEAGIVGAAAGMALRGLRPVVEIMFGDFLTLAADQLINHAAKFRWIYPGQAAVPLVVRTPMGGRRGYGPTHSQTLEKHFLGTPGLRTLAPTDLGDPGGLLREAILTGEDPTLFIENKLLYLLPVQSSLTLPDLEVQEVPPSPHPSPLKGERIGERGVGDTPCYHLSVKDAPPPVVTLAAYGYMASLARQALLRLAYEQEIFAELVVPTQLAPFALQPVLASARRTGRLLVIEEGAFSLGWGAEVLAQAAEALGPRLHAARRVAALDSPIPASGPLEAAVLPGIDQILQCAQELLR